MKFVIPSIAIIAIVTLISIARAFIGDISFWTAMWQVLGYSAYLVALVVAYNQPENGLAKATLVFIAAQAVCYMPVLYLCAAVGGMAFTLIMIMVFVPRSGTKDQPA